MSCWVDPELSILKSKKIGERIANVAKAAKS